MNTLTPRTDALNEEFFEDIYDKLNKNRKLARQLEQELNEAKRQARDYRSCLYGCHEHQLWQGGSCIGCIEAERDQLRKVADELDSKMNFVMPHMLNFASPNLIYDCNRILSHYSQLPHVQERKTK